MQEFGSIWSSALQANAPLIQGLFAFGGAALGGLVAMVTTRRLLDGNVERERIAREDARKKEVADQLRQNAERYLVLLWKIHAFEVDLDSNVIPTWVADHNCDPDKIPTKLQPPSELNSELRMLEQLHLEFLDGTVFDISDLLTEFAAHFWAYIVANVLRSSNWSEADDTTFTKQSRVLVRRLQEKIDVAAAKLKEQLCAAEIAR